jgi:hypothetical protein
LDISGVLRHLFGSILPQNDLVQANDCVDGRADLMAHAGEEVIFRAVQLFDLFFLFLGEGVLLFIHPIQEHEQDTGQQADHDHRERRVEKGMMLLVLSDQLWVIKSHAVANESFQRTEYKKRIPAPPMQGDADINKAKDKPFRHSAIKPARCKKADGKKR